MKKYIAILKFDNGTKIPATLEARERGEAMAKVANYCHNEGYFPIGIDLIDLFENKCMNLVQ